MISYLEYDLLILLHGLPEVGDLRVLLLQDGLHVANGGVGRRRRPRDLGGRAAGPAVRLGDAHGVVAAAGAVAVVQAGA